MKSRIPKFLIQDRIISRTKYVKYVRRRVAFFQNEKARVKTFETNTSVIMLANGGLVLPYFKNGRGRWKIVLVSQFRPAVKTVIVEAPGGMLDSEPPDSALTRELSEETGIKIKSRSVAIVASEYIHPSILSNIIVGGIVEIKANMVKNKKTAGINCENEWTRVEVFDLVEIMKKRDAHAIMLDLMTSRLIDEVAKVTKLLVKKY